MHDIILNMKKYINYILFFLLFVSCANGQSISSNSNIDGIYISNDFKAWKIYTENNNTFMECYTHTIFGNIIFDVEKQYHNGEFQLILRSNDERVPLLYGVIYLKNGLFYLDHSYLGAYGTINPVKKKGEYRRYDGQIYTKSEHLSFQNFRNGSF
jgi:hypothetical protein